MRPLPILLKAKANNEPLTEEEKAYLAKYEQQKNIRHSTSFIYHSRKLPKEDDERTD